MASRDLFFEDRTGNGGLNALGDGGSDDGVSGDSAGQHASVGAAVWDDEDDVCGSTSLPGAEGGVQDSGLGRGASTVNIKTVAKRRKLRKSVNEVAVSQTEYQKRVREYYAKEGSRIAAGTWAELPSQRLKKRRRSAAADNFSTVDSDSDHVGGVDKASELMRSTGGILSARSTAAVGTTSLSPGIIDIRRVADANKRDPNRAVVQALEFHPSGRLVMTAGLDRTMRLFQVDGKRNAKIQGIHLQDLPITSANFTGGGSEVVLMGRRAFFYQFDLESGAVTRVDTLSRGRNALKSLEECIASPDGSHFAVIGGKGRVVLVSNKSKQQTGVLRMDVPCSAATFSRENENHILTTGKGGAVYLWDVRNHACIDRHIDEGALVGTAISTSGSHYAIGSSTGVVNLYRHSAMRGAAGETVLRSGDRREQPDRTFMNLTTGISTLTFNRDGQILAVASRALKNAVRLVHVPTMSVYTNWPTQNVNLRRVSQLAFSPSGGFLAAGNDKGEALLFRVRNGYSAF